MAWPNNRRKTTLQHHLHKVAAYHAVERNRPLVTEAGGDARFELDQRDLGDGRHLDGAGLGDGQPDQLNQFGVAGSPRPR